MRILVLTNFFPPHHYGGYERQCQDVVDRWRGSGHEVEVVTSSWRVPGVADLVDEGGVRRELELYWDDHEIRHPSALGRWRIERHNRAVMRRAIAEHRPEVISLWAMGGLSLGLLVAAAQRPEPAVHVVCDDWLDYGPTIDAWMRAFASRPTLGRIVGAVTGLPTDLDEVAGTGTWCFISEATRQRSEASAPFRLGPSTVVPSGIDRTLFDVPPTDRPWRWRLVSVGRLDRRKGLDTAVQALSLLPPQATLVHDGDGDAAYRSEVLELAATLGVQDRVTLQVSARVDLPAVYAGGDAFVFPTRWDEPFGLAPIEAMACSTPVIATATGGSADFLTAATCMVVPVDDPSALAAAVTKLAVDADHRARLVAAGHRIADEYTVDRCAEELLGWHERALLAATP